MNRHKGEDGGCKVVGVPRDACYVRFGQRTAVVASTERLGLTVKGDEMFADFDADGRMLGIELLGPNKPCQGRQR